MSSDPNLLEKLSREELIGRARKLGAKRPELLTRPELRDEIIRLTLSDEEDRRRARGWFGVARDLVASVVSQGLNLPDTADLIRGVHVFAPMAAPPVATVTLAEIYAAQGHVRKALDLLDEVLAKEPDHDAARSARERWAARTSGPSEIQPSDIEAAVTSKSSACGDCASEVVSAEVLVDPVLEATPIAPSAPPLANDAESVDSESSQSDGHSEFSPRHSDAVANPPSAPVPDDIDGRATYTPGGDTVNGTEVVGAREADRVCIVRVPTEVGLRGLVIHWTLSPRTYEQLSEQMPLVLRVLEVETCWDGPRATEQNIPVVGAIGQVRNQLKSVESELRVAIGWTREEGFEAIALGVEFDWDGSGVHLRWAPPAMPDRAALEELGNTLVPVLVKQMDAA